MSEDCEKILKFKYRKNEEMPCKVLKVLGICYLDNEYHLKKTPLFFIFILSYMAMGSELQKDLDVFNKQCFDKEGNILHEGFIHSKMTSCIDMAKFLKDEIEKSEEAAHEQHVKETALCQQDENKSLTKLAQASTEASAKVQCSKKEIKKNEKDCSEQWSCNMYRSLRHVEPIVPSGIMWAVNKYVKKTIEKRKYGKDCLSKDKSDCLQEVVTSFIGNFWSTASSVWSLVKSGASSLWSPSSWFSKKSDSMHVAAVQKTDDVTSFIKSPGKFFENFFNKIKKSVNNWLMTSVFCQKWDGAPHLSKCVEPATSFACTSCEDKLNATCAAIGAITSEVGMMFLTAGAGNMVSVGAKIGAKAMQQMATKVAAKVGVKAPGIATPAILKTKSAKKVIAATMIAAKSAQNVATIGWDKLMKAKTKVEDFIHIIEETKLMKAISNVADVASDPLRVSQSVSRMGVNASNKILARVGSEQVKKKANLGLRVAERAKTSQRVNDVLNKRDNHSTRRLATKTSVVMKKKGFIAKHSNSQTTPTVGTHNTHSNTNTNSGPHQRPRKRDENKISLNNQNTQHQKTNNQNSGQTREIASTNNSKSHSKSESKNKGHGESSAKQHHNEHNEDKNKNGGPSKGLLAALAAADITNKVAQSSNNAEKSREERELSNFVRDDLKNAKIKNSQIKSDRDLTKALGVTEGRDLDVQDYNQKIDELEQTYSEENRESIVSNLQKSHGVSESDAHVLYNKRQQQIQSARNYVRNRTNINARTQRSTVSQKRQKEISALEEKSSSLQALVEKMNKDTASTDELLKKAFAAKAGDKIDTSIKREGHKSVKRVAKDSNSLSSATQSVGVPASFSGPSSFSSPESEQDEGRSIASITEPSRDKNEEPKQVSKTTEVDDVKEHFSDKTSSNLLSLMTNENVEIESDVTFTWNKNDVRAFSKAAQIAKDEFFKHLGEEEGRAKVKVRYNLPDFSLEVYEFTDGTKYSFLLDKNNHIELVPNQFAKGFIKDVVKLGDKQLNYSLNSKGEGIVEKNEL